MGKASRRKKRTKALKEREKLISQTAYKLWEEDGKPSSNSKHYWFKAIETLNSEEKKLHKYFLSPFITAEKQLEKVLAFLKTLAILEILEILGRITIVVGVISFILTEKQRRDAEVYQAWQVITAAHNQPGSGGRIKALELLNSQPKRFPRFWLKWDRESLSGLAAPKAYLSQIDLQLADLRYANFQGTDLRLANLQETDLFQAKLQGTNLFEANLQQAILIRANLSKANLSKANFQQAILRGTNLSEAKSQGVNLHNANLWEANLSKATLWEANLSKADLWKANLKEANLKEANLQEAILNNANLEKANLKGADLQAVNLKGANLQAAILEEAKNLNFKQIKSACFWEEAIYKGEWNSQKKTLAPIEPNNTKFIEDLKKDRSSDNQNSVDCTFWNK